MCLFCVAHKMRLKMTDEEKKNIVCEFVQKIFNQRDAPVECQLPFDEFIKIMLKDEELK